MASVGLREQDREQLVIAMDADPFGDPLRSRGAFALIPSHRQVRTYQVVVLVAVFCITVDAVCYSVEQCDGSQLLRWLAADDAVHELGCIGHVHLGVLSNKSTQVRLHSLMHTHGTEQT